MNLKSFAEAFVKFFSGVLLVGLLTFLPAGTLYFFNGWLLMCFLFIPMFFAGIIMLFKNHQLLKTRLDAKEKRKEQKCVLLLSSLMFVSGFLIAGFGVRFNWYVLPKFVSLIASSLFLLGYIFYAKVLKDNVYLSRTIQVQDNQKVVTTGSYAIVRHPMYSATLLLFLSMPLILGSVYSFLIFLAYPLIIGFRIKDEEKLLENELEGYKEYKQKVKYRLIPFIW